MCPCVLCVCVSLAIRSSHCSTVSPVMPSWWFPVMRRPRCWTAMVSMWWSVWRETSTLWIWLTPRYASLYIYNKMSVPVVLNIIIQLGSYFVVLSIVCIDYKPKRHHYNHNEPCRPNKHNESRCWSVNWDECLQQTDLVVISLSPLLFSPLNI